MTAPPKPTLRPRNPNFSSGPCAKPPGWEAAKLSGALTGRYHRSEPARAHKMAVKNPMFALNATVIAIALAGCAVLGNVYNAQYEIACPKMSDDELRAELRSDADAISQALGQPVQVIEDRPESLIFNVHVPSLLPPSFWWGVHPVDITMSYRGDETQPGLFIAVRKRDEPSEDDTIRKARSAVETVLLSSKCRVGRSWVNRFDPI